MDQEYGKQKILQFGETSGWKKSKVMHNAFEAEVRGYNSRARFFCGRRRAHAP